MASNALSNFRADDENNRDHDAPTAPQHSCDLPMADVLAISELEGVPELRAMTSWHDQMVRLTAWLRGLFSSADPETEAALREEYGAPDRDATQAERGRFEGRLGSIEDAEVEREELDALEHPHDENE